jgi:hypothetical protein
MTQDELDRLCLTALCMPPGDRRDAMVGEWRAAKLLDLLRQCRPYTLHDGQPSSLTEELDAFLEDDDE